MNTQTQAGVFYQGGMTAETPAMNVMPLAPDAFPARIDKGHRTSSAAAEPCATRVRHDQTNFDSNPRSCMSIWAHPTIRGAWRVEYKKRYVSDHMPSPPITRASSDVLTFLNAVWSTTIRFLQKDKA